MYFFFYQNLNIFKGCFVLFNKGFEFYVLCVKFLGQSFFKHCKSGKGFGPALKQATYSSKIVALQAKTRNWNF